MRFTANSIPHGTAFFFVDLRKDLAGSRWLLSKIAGGPHAATSIWNGINRLGLVAPWCDPGPRHHPNVRPINSNHHLSGTFFLQG